MSSDDLLLFLMSCGGTWRRPTHAPSVQILEETPFPLMTTELREKLTLPPLMDSLPDDMHSTLMSCDKP